MRPLRDRAHRGHMRSRVPDKDEKERELISEVNGPPRAKRLVAPSRGQSVSTGGVVVAPSSVTARYPGDLGHKRRRLVLTTLAAPFWFVTLPALSV